MAGTRKRISTDLDTKGVTFRPGDLARAAKMYRQDLYKDDMYILVYPSLSCVSASNHISAVKWCPGSDTTCLVLDVGTVLVRSKPTVYVQVITQDRQNMGGASIMGWVHAAWLEVCSAGKNTQTGRDSHEENRK